MHIKTLGSAAGLSVVLTGGGLDQVLGLLQLRELKPIHLFPSGRRARQMGHWPISRPGKAYVHIPAAFSTKTARGIEKFGKQVGR